MKAVAMTGEYFWINGDGQFGFRICQQQESTNGNEPNGTVCVRERESEGEGERE